MRAHHDALFGGRAPRLGNDTRAGDTVQEFIIHEQPELAEEISLQHFFARSKSSDL
jgi:hypothetical protein